MILEDSQLSYLKSQFSSKQKPKRLNSNRTTRINSTHGNIEFSSVKDETVGNTFNNYTNTVFDRRKYLKELWDKLGVIDDYRILFENIACCLSGQAQNEFYDLEIESLRKLEMNLIVSNRIIKYIV